MGHLPATQGMVAILVLLDYVGFQDGYPLFRLDDDVAILVLLDYVGFPPRRVAGAILRANGRNPCFTGLCRVSPLFLGHLPVHAHVAILVLLDYVGFQPSVGLPRSKY